MSMIMNGHKIPSYTIMPERSICMVRHSAGMHGSAILAILLCSFAHLQEVSHPAIHIIKALQGGGLWQHNSSYCGVHLQAQTADSTHLLDVGTTLWIIQLSQLYHRYIKSYNHAGWDWPCQEGMHQDIICKAKFMNTFKNMPSLGLSVKFIQVLMSLLWSWHRHRLQQEQHFSLLKGQLSCILLKHGCYEISPAEASNIPGKPHGLLVASRGHPNTGSQSPAGQRAIGNHASAATAAATFGEWRQ